MVIRVDNASACACINRGRSLSPTMGRAVGIMVNIQEENFVQVFSHHVQGEDNFVADWLSRGQYGKSQEYLEKWGSVAWVLEQFDMQ